MNLSLPFADPTDANAIAQRSSLESVVGRLREWMAQPNAPIPDAVHPNLREMLERRGIRELYTHQEEAFRIASAGRNVVAVTPTASGKTLCYNLPVLNKLLADPKARAFYLFPTKALAEDQLHE